MRYLITCATELAACDSETLHRNLELNLTLHI